MDDLGWLWALVDFMIKKYTIVLEFSRWVTKRNFFQFSKNLVNEGGFKITVGLRVIIREVPVIIGHESLAVTEYLNTARVECKLKIAFLDEKMMIFWFLGQ